MGTTLLVHQPGLEVVHAALAQCLRRVEERFDAQLRSSVPPVRSLTRHIERYRGKMLRPSLVCLCGMAARGAGARAELEAAVTDDHITLSAVCEMVHMATLVHDDVLDMATTRRAGLTVNHLHGNEAAVILGDFLFSAAFELCATLNGCGPGRDAAAASRLIGRIGMTLCEGELLQLHHRENYSVDEDLFFEIVRRKTASLIGVACRLGGWHAGCTPAQAEALTEFGEKLGIAFQIQDDLLDLTADEESIGKPVGQDAALGKLTLATILHLNGRDPRLRAQILHGLHGDRKQLRALLAESGSIAAARQQANRLVGEASASLQLLPNSAARSMLLALAEAAVDRDR